MLIIWIEKLEVKKSLLKYSLKQSKIIQNFTIVVFIWPVGVIWIILSVDPKSRIKSLRNSNALTICIYKLDWCFVDSFLNHWSYYFFFFLICFSFSSLSYFLLDIIFSLRPFWFFPFGHLGLVHQCIKFVSSFGDIPFVAMSAGLQPFGIYRCENLAIHISLTQFWTNLDKNQEWFCIQCKFLFIFFAVFVVLFC